MNIVEIEVGIKKYKISCKDGEENHIKSLGELINNKYMDLHEKFGPKSDRDLMFVIMLLVLQDETLNSKKQNNANSNVKAIIEKSLLEIDSLVENINLLQKNNK